MDLLAIIELIRERPIAAIEFVTAAACLAAIIFWIIGWKRPGFLSSTRLLMTVLLFLMLFYGLAMMMEWSGLGTREYWHFIENLASVFIPVTWAFVFYAFFKNAVEDDLQSGREYFRNLVESTSDWIWEVDVTMRYSYVSPQVENILGFTPREVLGKTPFELMPPEEAERISKFIEAAYRSKRSIRHLQNINLHKEGHRVYLESNALPILNARGELIGYRGIDRDITARVKAEQERKRQQAELKSIFAATPAGVGLVRKRHLTRGNERFFEITGYPKDELTGLDPRNFYLSDEEYLAVGAKYDEAMETGRARIETRFVRKDQTVIDVVIYISPVDRDNPDTGFVVVLQDITEVKAARREALAEKARAQSYLDVVNVMILVLDTAGRVQMLNKKGCELLECTLEEAVGADWYKTFLPGSYRDIVQNGLNRILHGDAQSVAYFENPILTQTGVQKLIAWHNAPLYDEAGKVVGVISSGQDITEERAAQTALRESDERLRVALSAAKMGSWRWQINTDEDVRDANLNAILGLPAEETVQSKKDFFQYVHPDDCQAAQTECEQAISNNRSCRIQFRIIRKDGQVRWVLDQGKPFYDANGQLDYMTGVLVDVTEQVESQMRFNNVVESSPMGILTYQLESDDRLVLTGSNEAANTILGVTFSASTGKTIEAIFPELEAMHLPDEFRRICREGGSYHGDNYDYRDERVSGFYEFDAFQTSPGKMAVMFLDVTERKLAEEQLRESRDSLKREKERFENMFHIIPDPIYMKDMDSRFTHVNEAYLKLAGLANEQDVIGKTDFDTYDEERARVFYEDEQEILRTGIPKVGYEERGLWLDGRVTWCLSTKMPLRDAAGNIIGLIGISHDITERKQAREELRKSEEKNRAWLENSPVCTKIVDADFKLQYMSHAGVTGLKIDDVTEYYDKPYPFDLYPEESRKALLENMEKARQTGQAVELEVSVFDTEGNEWWYQTIIVSINDPQGQLEYFMVVSSGITERRQAEKAMLESEEKYRTIFHSGNQGFFLMTDIFLDCNDRVCEIWACQRDEVIGHSPVEFSPEFQPDGRTSAEAAKAYIDAALAGQPQRFYWLYQRKDGTLVDTEITLDRLILKGQSLLQATMSDITERKLAEQQLRDNAAALKKAQQIALLGFYDWNLRDNTVKASEGLKTFFGCEPDEKLTFEFVASRIHPEDRERFVQADETSRKQGVPFSMDYRVLLPDGTIRWGHDQSEVMVDEQGNSVRMFGAIQDITERKKAEQKRELLLQQLADRNDELQSIVFAAAHDLRSPLVNIAGFTGELEKDLVRLSEFIESQPLPESAIKEIKGLFETDLAESVRFITAGSTQMNTLLDGLLRLSRVGSATLSFEQLNMNNLVELVIEGLQYQANEHNAEISVQSDLPDCLGDEGLLSQVFTNLIDNAMKYRHPDRSPIVTVSAAVIGDQVEYAIADNGIGIDSEHLDKVFELFHRLDMKEKQGEGLGLTIVRRILDRLNGSVRIDSTPDVGTTIYVRMPMA